MFLLFHTFFTTPEVLNTWFRLIKVYWEVLWFLLVISVFEILMEILTAINLLGDLELQVRFQKACLCVSDALSIWKFQMMTVKVIPYWQILENSSRSFPKFRISGHELDRFTGKRTHIVFRLNVLFWMNFPVTRSGPPSGSWPGISGLENWNFGKFLDEFPRISQ